LHSPSPLIKATIQTATIAGADFRQGEVERHRMAKRMRGEDQPG
jgi:hypothetical protein